MGIGETSWEFLEEGQEELCSAATFRFFAEICAVMGTPPRADERARAALSSHVDSYTYDAVGNRKQWLVNGTVSDRRVGPISELDRT